MLGFTPVENPITSLLSSARTPLLVQGLAQPFEYINLAQLTSEHSPPCTPLFDSTITIGPAGMYVLFWLLALIPLSLGAVIQDRDDSQPLEEVYIPESGEMAIDIPPFGNGTATGDDPEVSKYGELVRT